MPRTKINIATLSATTLISALITLPAVAEEKPKQLDDLIVTAELIDRPLSESSTSIQILDQESLQKRAGLVTADDVLDRISNISAVIGTGKAPTIRGVDGNGPAQGGDAFFAGSRARLNWQIDGRPANVNEINYGDVGLWDVERIEVLRGAQSTLTGRNSIAGTVVIKTNDPIFEQENSFQIAAGNHDQFRSSAMTNIPLTDTVAIRLAADWYESTSAVDYDSYEGVSDPGEKESMAVRGKLLFSPSDKTNLLLTVNHATHKEPHAEIVVKPYSDRDSNFPQQARHEPKTTSFIADFDTVLTDTLSLEINASYTDFDFDRKSPSTTALTIDTDEYAFEPRLRYQNNNGLNAVVGFYSFHARQDESIDMFGGQDFEDDTDTSAIYTETVIPINESFDLSLGLRYEREKHERQGGNAAGAPAVSISADDTYHALLPKFGLSWYPTDDSTYGFQVARGYNAGGGGIAFNGVLVSNYEFDPEYVWNYELFGRQSFADGRIKTTQNIFFSSYKDMQLPFDLTPNIAGDESFVVRNADKVETYGAELGISYAINSEFEVYGDLGLLHTEIVDFSGGVAEGNELLTAPSVTASAGVLWEKANWDASFGTKYSNSYYSDVNNRKSTRTESYVIADAQLAYSFKHVRIFGSIRNMFDADEPVAKPSADTAVLLQPRTFMVGLQTTF